MNTVARYTVLVEKGEDGYLLSEVVEIPGCHTQAKSMKELMARTKEAISLCLHEHTPKRPLIAIKNINVEA